MAKLVKSWGKVRGKGVYYIDLYYTEIVVVSHFGSGHTDNAGTATIKNFLEGKFKDIIMREFGKEILQEVVRDALRI